jgi:hypothetical protein
MGQAYLEQWTRQRQSHNHRKRKRTKRMPKWFDWRGTDQGMPSSLAPTRTIASNLWETQEKVGKSLSKLSKGDQAINVQQLATLLVQINRRLKINRS